MRGNGAPFPNRSNPSPTDNGALSENVDLGDNRRRYFDRSLGCNVVQVFQGDYYVTNRSNEVLTTVLGSCIAACVRDPRTGYGGMNHFLLPDAGGGDATGVSLRYGSFAMEQLINDVLARGGQRESLEIKVFGGGNVVQGLTGVGHKNADFIETYLRNEGFIIASQHLRGHSPRKVQYFPRTGRARMRELASSMGKTILEKEVSQTVRTNVNEDSGAIELFD